MSSGALGMYDAAGGCHRLYGYIKVNNSNQTSYITFILLQQRQCIALQQKPRNAFQLILHGCIKVKPAHRAGRIIVQPLTNASPMEPMRTYQKHWSTGLVKIILIQFIHITVTNSTDVLNLVRIGVTNGDSVELFRCKSTIGLAICLLQTIVV
jgi:hypothetical protein